MKFGNIANIFNADGTEPDFDSIIKEDWCRAVHSDGSPAPFTIKGFAIWYYNIKGEYLCLETEDIPPSEIYPVRYFPCPKGRFKIKYTFRTKIARLLQRARRMFTR